MPKILGSKKITAIQNMPPNFSIDNFDPTKYELNYDQLPVMDKWLLSRLNTTVQAVDNDLANLTRKDNLIYIIRTYGFVCL